MKVTKKSKKKIMIITVAIIVVIAVALAAIFVFKNKRRREQFENMKDNFRVSTMALEKMDLVESISATGTINSAETKEVSARVQNIDVKEVLVSVGDYVNAGDTLIKFDESDLKENFSDAKEELSDVKSSVSSDISDAAGDLSDAKDAYNDNKSKLNDKVSDAKSDLKEAKNNLKKMKNQGAPDEQIRSAEQAVEQAENAYEQACETRDNTNDQNQNSIKNAQKNYKNTQSNGEKSIKNAEDAVEAAEEALENCSVTAPISGVITSVSVSAGDMYNGGIICVIDDTEGFTVSTSVDEYDISNVSVGNRVAILTEATGDEELEGEITFVAPTVAEGGSGYEIGIDINTKNDKLRMGLTAKCSIILSEVNDVYAVPYDAITTEADGSKYITILNAAGEQQTVTVNTGMESDYYVEISGAELTDGMQVVMQTDETDSSDSSDMEDIMGGMPGGGMPGGMNFDDMPGGGGMPGGGEGMPGGGGGRPSGGMGQPPGM